MVDFVAGLYRKYLPALGAVRQAQLGLYAQRGDTHLERYAVYRALSAALARLGLPAHYKRRLKPQLDDIESEITYLLLRDYRPEAVVEIAPDRGWSTTWMLHALRDNGTGHLYSYDLYDHSTRAVPRNLAAGRWTFVQGDVTRNLDRLPPRIDYLFLDGGHSADFAEWCLGTLFPHLSPGTPVSVHDIFPPPEAAHRFGEARVVQRWLSERKVAYFTASPAAAREVYDRLVALRRDLGIAKPIHWSRKNPMVFFRV